MSDTELLYWLKGQVQEWLDLTPRPYAWRTLCMYYPQRSEFRGYRMFPFGDPVTWAWRTASTWPIVDFAFKAPASWAYSYLVAIAVAHKATCELLNEGQRTLGGPVSKRDLARLQREAGDIATAGQDWRPSEMIPEDYYA